MKGSRLFLATYFRNFGAEALSALDFSYFGVGRCADSGGTPYEAIRLAGTKELMNNFLVPLPLETSDEYCLDWCSQNDHSNLVGASVHRDWKVMCYCLFSGGFPDDLELNEYDPPGLYEGGYVPVAEGPVQTSNIGAFSRYEHEKCYVNNNYDDPSPSSSPSELGAPSNIPSASLKPSLSTRPSGIPSANPSLSPSKSYSPSETPLTSSDFTYFYINHCAGISRRRYNSILSNEIIHGPGVVTHDVDCIDWCLQNPFPFLAGVEIFNSTVQFACICLIDAYPLPVGPSDYDPVAKRIEYLGSENFATGPVQQTHGNSLIRCYKNNRYGATSKPSSEPSLLPSLMPSQEPSLIPSITPSSIPSESPSEGSGVPSLTPSSSPSLSPSLSSSPSSLPSSTPSDVPSLSSQPSVTSSDNPSSFPSSTPSLRPSLEPTLHPSSEPSLSLKPSSSPSISIEPTITSEPSWPEQPSTTPSYMPSEMPSLLPSVPPSTVLPTTTSLPSYTPLTSSDFSYFGQGTCRSASNSKYNYVQSYNFYTSTTDAIDCIDWCLQNPHTELSGMYITRYPTIGHAICYCLIDASPIPFSPTDYEPIQNQVQYSNAIVGGAAVVNSNRQSSTLGPIEMTDGRDEVDLKIDCYVNNRYGALPTSQPSSSNLPTISIQPSSNCANDVMTFRTWFFWNMVIVEYDFQVDRGDLNGNLLQKDCSTSIDDTTINAFEYNWVYTSGGKEHKVFQFQYTLDPDTIRDSVIFNQRNSHIELCHAVERGCSSRLNKRIIRIPVRRQSIGSLFGDPHITTFDGLQFDCQAAGEFTTLTSLEDPDFKIQERFTAIDSTCGQASISTGVALKDTGRPVIQVSTPRGGGTSLNTVNGCPIDFYVDGSANGISGMDLSSSNMDITAETDRVKIKQTDTTFSLDVIVRSSDSFGCHIMVQVSLPGNFHEGETLLGLLGTPNEDVNDDWRASNGDVISPPATEAESLFSTAYSYCVTNWCVDDASDSIFSYGVGESFDSINKCDVPFSNDVEDAVLNLVNDPSLNQDLSDACGDSLVCLVDGVCGDVTDAIVALNSEQVIADTQEELAASIFSSEETEVTDIEEVIDDVEEQNNGGSSDTAVTQTKITDIYWYPAWDKGSSESVCYNDGEASQQMKKTGLFFETSREACCKRFFNWDLMSCMGEEALTPSGFYPNWGNPEVKCLNSIEQIGEENSLPGYMMNNPQAWLYDNIESCCKKYYYWDVNNCIVGSGGTVTLTFTNKWYANQDDEICKQDCQEDPSSPTCGGNPNGSWDHLYDTPELCCAHKLSWVPSNTCVQKSLSQTVTGSRKWYVDWTMLKCVKDCENGANCGGFAKNTVLFDDVYICCGFLFWKDRSECV